MSDYQSDTITMLATNRKTLIVILLIISQLACIIFISSRKQEFNIDEIYSYILSNSYHVDKLSGDDDLWGRWTDTDVLTKYVTVQEGERFALGSVYRNNTTDCHPPLYYWFLHLLLPVMLYGFSPIAVETATFIRMYMLVTLFAVILSLVILCIALFIFATSISERIGKKKAAWTEEYDLLCEGSLGEFYRIYDTMNQYEQGEAK